ncbi:MAG: FKBP-type peptidyl-prolyl cis-trans isomerase [Salinivirgaceae bacterium]|nr:FKBP-type peptidyl-prolyl cis-trans isomerase [Salinivirgaceae bacterium]
MNLSLRIFKISLIFFAALFVFGCSKDEEDKDTRSSDEKILEYLAEHNIEAIKDTSGLYYYIERQGDGTYMDTTQTTVYLFYKGYFTNGRVFDSRTTSPYGAVLSETVKGWQIGIPLFDKGAKGKLFIPSELGYGPNDYNEIPGNSVLIFDIEVVKFYGIKSNLIL